MCDETKEALADTQKKELMDIVNRLPLTKVIQLLEFAKRLQVPGIRDRESLADAVRRTHGKYKNILSSSEEFAAEKSDERFLEDH